MINTKLLIALIVLLLGFGGYYAYGQYQQTQEILKSNDQTNKILNATPRRGIY
jgi:uncharacterized membrane protein YukC